MADVREKGVRCPVCGGVTPVKYTRHAGSVTMRVRECRDCSERVKTREMIVADRSR